MMRKTSKVAMIMSLSLTMAFATAVGATQIRASASTDAATVVKNDGTTTDFVDYWWGGSAMSSVLNDAGETVHLTAESDVFHPIFIFQYVLQNLGVFLITDG